MSVPPQQAFTPQHVLVVTLADLGDAIITTPALLALRQALPTARITVLTTPVGAAALRGLAAYDDVIVFEKQRFDSPRQAIRPANLLYAIRLWRKIRAAGFDSCVILHHFTTWFGTLKYATLAATSRARRRYGLDNGRGFFLTDRVHDQGYGARHQADYWLAVVALLGADQRPLPLFATAATFVPGKLPPRSSGPLIALHPGTGAFAPARRWSPQRFAAVADALLDEGAQIVLVGGVEEQALRQAVLGSMRQAAAVHDLGGQTSLPELASVFGQCELFIGNDSGLSHLASSVGTPAVVVFGPTDPHAWGPYGGEPWTTEAHFSNGVAVLRSGIHRALWAEIGCSPCIYRRHSLGTPNGCPDKTCLRRVEVDQMLQVVRQQLYKRNSSECVSTT